MSGHDLISTPGVRATSSQKYRILQASESDQKETMFWPLSKPPEFSLCKNCQLSREKNFKKSHRFPYLAYDHGDAGGGDDGDDDDVYAASLSRTPYSRSLGRSCASLVRQLLYQRSLVASCYPDTSGTHLGSSWNV